MKPFAVVLALYCVATAVARPGHHGGGNIQLEGVPDISSYGKLQYPKYDLIELGSSSHGSAPPTIVHITKESTVKVPQPYPVKVPYKVPYPVHIAKPYPVVETKIVKVPHPVPVEVIKNVPVHIEVPKPYPVPSNEVKSSGGDDHAGTFGGSFSGHGGFDQGSYQHLAGGGEGGHFGNGEGGHSGGGEGYQGGFEGGHSGYGGDHGQADQSGGYGAVAQPQQAWAPAQEGYGSGAEDGQQQQEEHH